MLKVIKLNVVMPSVVASQKMYNTTAMDKVQL
jgi:hypothetical protein